MILWGKYYTLKTEETIPLNVIPRLLVTAFFAVVLLPGLKHASAAVREPAEVEVRVQNARSGLHTDQVLDTLRRDDGTPYYAFRLPDVYGDDWRNLRFQAPVYSQLVAVGFAFPTRGFSQWTSGDPTLLTRVWPSGEDLFPAVDAQWLTDTTAFTDFSASVFSLDSTWRNLPSQFAWVDLSSYGVALDSGQWFHAGYSAILNSSDDSLAILSDDGSPASPYASEWYNGHFMRMSESWPAVNFFIRVVLDHGSSGMQVLSPQTIAQDFQLGPVWPNPFNSRCMISLDVPQAGSLRLSIFDLLGRERAVLANGYLTAGSHLILWEATDFSTGSYFIRLQSAEVARTIPVILLK